MEPAKGVPPLEVRYHWIEVPVASRSATVGLSVEQKLWEVLPVGGGVLFTVTVAEPLVVAVQPSASVTETRV